MSINISAEEAGGEGIHVGAVRAGVDFVWRYPEIPYSAFLSGAPGQGKTSGIIHMTMQLVKQHTGIVVDLRGDYECLCRVTPGARFFEFGRFPINLLRGSSRVAPALFFQKFCEVFADQFDQHQASRRYLNMVLDLLEAKHVESGHWPCLLDLKDALEDRKEERGSSEQDFRNRCLARIDAICRALGEKALGVEQGIDLEALIETGGLLVFQLNAERSIADFLANWLLMYIFEHRAAAENKFNQRPIVFILDEQRNILQARRNRGGGEEVTNFELLLTRGRALGISFLIAEQVPSEICAAAKISPQLVLAFNTSGKELFATAELLGTRNPQITKKLQALDKGECVARLMGSRCPVPLLLRIPYPPIDRSNLTHQEKETLAAQSLADLLPKVRPRYTGFIEQRQEDESEE